MEKVTFKLESYDLNENELSVNIEGYSELKFWKHDLKIAAAIALLETVDLKDFHEAGKLEVYEKSLSELRKIVDRI